MIVRVSTQRVRAESRVRSLRATWRTVGVSDGPAVSHGVSTGLRRLSRWLLARGDRGFEQRHPCQVQAVTRAVLDRYGRNLIRALRHGHRGRGRVATFDVIRSPFVYKKTREQFALVPRIGRFGIGLGQSERAHLIRVMGATRLPGPLGLKLRD